MACHPDIVPGEHAHSEDEDAGIEQLLAGARKQCADLACKGGNDAGAGKSGDDAEGNPDSPRRHAFGRGEHDADDESRLEDFAKNDEERCKHWLLGDDHAFGGVFVIFADEGIFAGIERPETHSA